MENLSKRIAASSGFSDRTLLLTSGGNVLDHSKPLLQQLTGEEVTTVTNLARQVVGVAVVDCSAAHLSVRLPLRTTSSSKPLPGESVKLKVQGPQGLTSQLEVDCTTTAALTLLGAFVFLSAGLSVVDAFACVFVYLAEKVYFRCDVKCAQGGGSIQKNSHKERQHEEWNSDLRWQGA